MATGGLSLPKTGSDGGGLDIAGRLGHTIVPTTPALVPLVDDDEPWHRTLTGVSQEAELALWTGGSIARRLTGSLLWTHFGSSGPVVLDMSRHWLRAQLAGQDPRITLNLLPGRSFESLEEEWRDRTASRPRTSVQGILGGLMPAAVAASTLARVCARSCHRARQFLENRSPAVDSCAGRVADDDYRQPRLQLC